MDVLVLVAGTTAVLAFTATFAAAMRGWAVWYLARDSGPSGAPTLLDVSRHDMLACIPTGVAVLLFALLGPVQSLLAVFLTAPLLGLVSVPLNWLLRFGIAMNAAQYGIAFPQRVQTCAETWAGPLRGIMRSFIPSSFW